MSGFFWLKFWYFPKKLKQTRKRGLLKFIKLCIGLIKNLCWKLCILFLLCLDRLPRVPGLASWPFPLSFKLFKYSSSVWVQFLKCLMYLSPLCQCTKEIILDLSGESIPAKKISCVWDQVFRLQLSRWADWWHHAFSQRLVLYSYCFPY